MMKPWLGGAKQFSQGPAFRKDIYIFKKPGFCAQSLLPLLNTSEPNFNLPVQDDVW